MGKLVLYNATIVTGERVGAGSVIIEGDRIRSVVFQGDGNFDGSDSASGDSVVDLGGMLLLAGGVDAHVHFREPGLTWKADFGSESRAALAGGVTSVLDMPNTVPPTVDMESLEEKAHMADGRSWVNFGFHLGATNGNSGALAAAARSCGDRFAGIKVFMGSSTGDMRLDDRAALEKVFNIKGKTVSVHAEDDDIIARNMTAALSRFGEWIPVAMHPWIRSRESCVAATRRALDLALGCGTRLHVLHVSTAEEVELIARAKAACGQSFGGVGGAVSGCGSGLVGGAVSGCAGMASGARITAETSVNYLWFSDEDYERLGARIKCNPAIKSASDRAALLQGLREGVIDTVGSDHAPHLISEKEGFGRGVHCDGVSAAAPGRPSYSKMASGIPSVQFSLPALLTLARRGDIPLGRVAAAFSERPAEIFGIRDRGRIVPGAFADLVVVDQEREWTVTKDCILSKCGWSPYEGERFLGGVEAVVLGGRVAYVREASTLTIKSPATESPATESPATKKTTAETLPLKTLIPETPVPLGRGLAFDN